MSRIQKRKIKQQLRIVVVLVVIIIALSVILIDNVIQINNLKKQEVIIQTIKKEVIVEVEVEKPTNYTSDELYCMAVVIYNEAGGNKCTDQQREYVGYVVLNRVNSSKYPNTIRKVLEQPGQYAGLGTSGINFAKRASNTSEAKALERAWATAKKVLENRNNIPIPSNVIYQAEFKQGKGVYKQIGNTYFCYS